MGTEIPEHQRNYCCHQNSKKVRDDSGISENLLEPDWKVLEITLFSTPCHTHLTLHRSVLSLNALLVKDFQVPYI